MRRRSSPALQRERARAGRRARQFAPRRSIKHLSNIGDQDIVGLEIPTGQPIVYELDDDLSVSDRYYLSERPA